MSRTLYIVKLVMHIKPRNKQIKYNVYYGAPLVTRDIFFIK